MARGRPKKIKEDEQAEVAPEVPEENLQPDLSSNVESETQKLQNIEKVEQPLSEEVPKVEVEPLAPTLEKSLADLRSIESDLQQKVAQLSGSEDKGQESAEIVRLGAANLLRSTQAKAVEIGVLLDTWRGEYQEFLVTKRSVDESKKYLNDLSDTVNQQQKVFVRSENLTDIQWQNLVALCNLPEEKFQMLLS